ncbi:hypothetical protein ZHS_39 [Edwardsiella phage vB_EpM_ZHS]|nr:hypothetical protein ZHS_39 [Edwardsiella phage vB_EpM_ZHS]
MTGWLIVLAVAAVFAGVIWWWHWLDRKHMRDSIREANAHMERLYPGWTQHWLARVRARNKR